MSTNPTSQSRYIGNLRTEAVHLRSGQTIITDAPTDNNGRGEAFSPTDLAATSLASCLMTIMGIVAAKNGIPFHAADATVTKHMNAEPRMISKIEVRVKVLDTNIQPAHRKLLERSARSCPVALSLHPDVEQVISFKYPD